MAQTENLTFDVKMSECYCKLLMMVSRLELDHKIIAFYRFLRGMAGLCTLGVIRNISLELLGIPCLAPDLVSFPLIIVRNPT